MKCVCLLQSYLCEWRVMLRWAVLVSLVAPGPAQQHLLGRRTIYADDPRIVYTGRAVRAGQGSSSLARLSWPATRISVTFSGSWLAANLSGTTGGGARRENFIRTGIVATTSRVLNVILLPSPPRLFVAG